MWSGTKRGSPARRPATQAALAEAFSESDLPWRVDVVDWSNLTDPFKAIIMRDKVALGE